MPGEWSAVVGAVIQSRGNNLMYTASDKKLWLESEWSNGRVLKWTVSEYAWSTTDTTSTILKSIECCSSWSGVSYLILASWITGLHYNMPCTHLKSKMRRFIHTASQMPYHTHPIIIIACSACAQNNCRTTPLSVPPWLGTQNRLKSEFGTGYQLAFNCAPGRVSDVEIRRSFSETTWERLCTYDIW